MGKVGSETTLNTRQEHKKIKREWQLHPQMTGSEKIGKTAKADTKCNQEPIPSQTIHVQWPKSEPNQVRKEKNAFAMIQVSSTCAYDTETGRS